ncbi:hypothetical protein KPH14_012579 [Odynerus spinipes]|uniref:Endonuclease/exonuclease/phosphatase domain-containing protein n=1 Tax=Odynerus spinipes TaxID=1348599 RepID=A0AAD9RF16_9HYME|nr:hypothetical protein KPH14_012579 [Odynerus spinipes]
MEKLEKNGGEKERVDGLQEKLGKIEMEMKVTKEGGERAGGEEIREASRRIEEKIEAKEREERRKNVVVRGMKVKREEAKEKVEELMKEIGVGEGIEKVKEVKEDRGKDGSKIIVVELKSMETKREVMGKKKYIKNREIWIKEDLTWEERRIQWKLRNIAREEARKGNTVWVGRRAMKVNVEWWLWDGIANKDKDYWNRIRRWDVIVMIETWIEEKGWERLKERMPQEYDWECKPATRRSKKGRAMGGMVMGVRQTMLRGKDRGVEEVEEGWIKRTVWIEEEKWKIVGVYVNGDIERKMEKIKDWGEERCEGAIKLIVGDFNARTGTQGGRIWGEEEEDQQRRSKDGRINREGRRMLEAMNKTTVNQLEDLMGSDHFPLCGEIQVEKHNHTMLSNRLLTNKTNWEMHQASLENHTAYFYSIAYGNLTALEKYNDFFKILVETIEQTRACSTSGSDSEDHEEPSLARVRNLDTTQPLSLGSKSRERVRNPDTTPHRITEGGQNMSGPENEEARTSNSDEKPFPGALQREETPLEEEEDRNSISHDDSDMKSSGRLTRIAYRASTLLLNINRHPHCLTEHPHCSSTIRASILPDASPPLNKFESQS